MLYLICGKARSGKHEVNKFISDYLKECDHKVCSIQIMRTLKGYLKDYFGWDGHDETKPRELLQKFGTEIIREKLNMPLFHIDRLTEDINVLSAYFDTFIVDDIRFPLEIEELTKRFKDVVVINVERDINTLTEEERKHITEVALDNYNEYDYVIENNSNLDDLKEKVEIMVREVERNEVHDE